MSEPKELAGDELLRSLYYSPATQGGLEKLYYLAIKRDPTITYAQVRKFLKNQKSVQLTKPEGKIPYFPLSAHSPFQRIQIDLLDVQNINPHLNRGTKYIFLAVDVYSRYATAVPLKNKNTQSVTQALTSTLTSIRKLAPLYFPLQVDSDSEKAFMSTEFHKILEDEGIKHNPSRIGDHPSQGVVDRFCRTLREKLTTYQNAFSTSRYIDNLPLLIQNYNQTKHRTLGITPEQAANGVPKKKIPLPKPLPPIRVGDKVRVRLTRKVFEKGTVNRWSSTVHAVESVRNEKYLVSDRKEPYKRYELQPVSEVQSEPTPGAVEDAILAEREKEKEETRQYNLSRTIKRRANREGIEFSSA